MPIYRVWMIFCHLCKEADPEIWSDYHDEVEELARDAGWRKILDQWLCPGCSSKTPGGD